MGYRIKKDGTLDKRFFSRKKNTEYNTGSGYNLPSGGLGCGGLGCGSSIFTIIIIAILIYYFFFR